MKELKEEAKRHHEAKLHKYGADHKACGGTMKKYAHGGKVEHPHEKKDKHLAKEIEHEAKEIERDHEGKKHGGHIHRIDGGPVSRLGRGRKGGKGKTSVNIAIGKPGGDAGASPMPPSALGAGPAVPSAPPPRPILGGGAPAGMPPRPMPAPGPMKRGGSVEKREHEKHHGKHHEKHEHERHHGHSEHHLRKHQAR